MGELETDTRPVFCYSDEEVAASLLRKGGRHESKDNLSEFDSMLCSRWDGAMSSGVFRYNLSEITTRTVPGAYRFIAQRNPKRFSHRRKPMDVFSLTQPFDGEQFNFNKIKKEEILFEIRKRSPLPGQGEGRGEEEKQHMIVVNVSPIDYGHVLLVPEPRSCLPQVMTEDSIQLCLELLAMSGHRNLCMVANSLLAYASVNHLHYHFMYVTQPLLAAKVVGKPLTRCCYELTNHPSLGYGFEVTTTAKDCARDIYKVVALLLQCDMPHNVVMLWGDPFRQTQSDEDDVDRNRDVIRTLVIPRKPAYGLKNLYTNEQQEIPPFNAAACELGLGFIPVVDQTKYPTLTEEEILKLLWKHSLSSEEFHPLKTRVTELLNND